MSASSCPPAVQPSPSLPTVVQQQWQPKQQLSTPTLPPSTRATTPSHRCSPQSKTDIDRQPNSVCNCVDCSPPTYHLDSDELLKPFDEQQWLNEVTLSRDSQWRLSQRHRATIRRRMRSAQKRNASRRQDVRQLFDGNKNESNKPIAPPESKQTSSKTEDVVKRSNSSREYDRHDSGGRHRSLPSILWNSIDSSSLSSNQTDELPTSNKDIHSVSRSSGQRRRSRFVQLMEHFTGKVNHQYRFDETIQQPLLSLPPLANGRRHSWWVLQSPRKESTDSSAAVEILSMKQRTLTDKVQHFVADPHSTSLPRRHSQLHDINHNLLHPSDKPIIHRDNSDRDHQSETNSIANAYFLDQSSLNSSTPTLEDHTQLSSSDRSTDSTLEFFAPYIVLPNLDDCGFNLSVNSLVPVSVSAAAESVGKGG